MLKVESEVHPVISDIPVILTLNIVRQITQLSEIWPVCRLVCHTAHDGVSEELIGVDISQREPMRIERGYRSAIDVVYDEIGREVIVALW